MDRQAGLATVAAGFLLLGLTTASPPAPGALASYSFEWDAIPPPLLSEEDSRQSGGATLVLTGTTVGSGDAGRSGGGVSAESAADTVLSEFRIGNETASPAYVFPPDDRERITPTTGYPWSSISKLYAYVNGAIVSECSGAIIDPFHVLTAGHCIYIWENSMRVGWVDSMQVVPGADSGYAPFGDAWATSFRTYVAWTESADPQHDWALVTLDRNIGQFTGWLGLLTTDPSDAIYSGEVETAGYPGDLDGGQNMYHTSAAGCGADAHNHYTWLDTAAGQSGSPVWWSDSSGSYIVSILAYSSDSPNACNWATRIDSQKFDDILAWSASDSPPSGSADLVAPRTTGRLSGTEGNDGWYRSSVTITLSAVDASGVALTYYRLDGGPWASYSVPITVTDGGFHILEYYSIDRAGNTEVLQSQTLRIDSHPPADLRILAPTDGVVVNTHTVRVSWSATDRTSGISHYIVQIDEDDPIDVGGQTFYHLQVLSDGDHTVRIVAIDSAGNQVEADVRFRVDTSILSASGPYGLWVVGMIIGMVTVVSVALSVWLVLRKPPRVSGGPFLAPPTPPIHMVIQAQNLCARCKSFAPPGSRYCGRCGQPLLSRQN